MMKNKVLALLAALGVASSLVFIAAPSAGAREPASTADPTCPQSDHAWRFYSSGWGVCVDPVVANNGLGQSGIVQGECPYGTYIVRKGTPPETVMPEGTEYGYHATTPGAQGEQQCETVPPSEATYPTQGGETVPAGPSFTVTGTGPSRVYVNQYVSPTFTIRNTGTEQLRRVSVNVAGSLACYYTSIEVGEQAACGISPIRFSVPEAQHAFTADVTAFDASGNTEVTPASTTFTTQVLRLPTVRVSRASAGVYAGRSMRLQVSASDSDGLRLSYAASGMPLGVAINSAGVIYGSPASRAAKVFPITVRATDTAGATATTRFNLTVRLNTMRERSGIHIGGTRKVGRTIKVTDVNFYDQYGKRVYPSLSYKWYANGKTISGAKKSSLKISSKLRGKRLQVRVSAARTYYYSTSVISAKTGSIGR